MGIEIDLAVISKKLKDFFEYFLCNLKKKIGFSSNYINLAGNKKITNDVLPKSLLYYNIVAQNSILESYISVTPVSFC